MVNDIKMYKPSLDFDGNGYMVTSCYVKALGENLYYWISEDGVWDENETTATPNRARYLVY